MVLLLCGTALGFVQDARSERDRKIAELIGNLGTRYWEKAADELVGIGEAAVERLIETLNTGSGRPAENANYVLCRIGNLKAVEAVIRALRNPEFHHRVRAYAAQALGEMESEEHSGPLIEALQTDSHWWVRNSAVGSLGKIGSEKSVDPLIGALQDENPYVRRAAVSVLGEMKPAKAVQPLIGVLGDEDWKIRLKTPEVLVGFGRKTEELLLEALRDEDEWVKVGAVHVLGRIESEKSVSPLISLLEYRERRVRDEAAVALGRIKSDRAAAPLIGLLRHEMSYIREEAAWVLGEMRSKDAVLPLIQVLDDRDTGWMAAVALGKIGDEQAFESLKKKGAEQDTRVGRAAAWALARMQRDKIENSK